MTPQDAEGTKWRRVARLLRAVWTIFRHDPRWQIIRYAVFGVAVSLGYTVNVILFVEVFGWPHPALASALCFIIWTPVSYIGHRDFTFVFTGQHFNAAIKFGLTFVIRLAISAYTVQIATDIFHVHYLFGVLANWIVLPLITYFVLDMWVFRARRSATESRTSQ